MKALRIALYGNMCNFLYQIAKALRNPDQAGVAHDAHLYIERTSDLQNRPEADDPELAGNSPDWVHVGDWMHGRRRALGVLWPAALPVVREWRGYDLLIVSAEGPSAARFAGRPYLFLTGGGDLTLMPFPDRYNAGDPDGGWLRALVWRLRARWQRAGIRAASSVLTQPFRPFLEALDALGVRRDRISGTTSLLALDTARFRRNPAATVPTALEGTDFLVFHPSRLMIRDDPVLRATGQWKANEVLLRGFAAFLRSGQARRPVLALIERSHARDIALARAEIARLDLQDHVVWLRGPTAEGFSRSALIDLYSVSDVVADDFGAGWFGSVALEGCAAECPVLTYVDEAAMAQMYPWHPFVNARNEQDVARELKRLNSDTQLRRQIGQRGRDWVVTFHALQPHRAKLRAELMKHALP